MKAWTPEEDAQLRSLYDQMPARQIGDIMGRTRASIKNRINKLAIAKGENSGCFPKGHASWNKGTHFIAGGRSPETRFKPGHRGGRALEVYQPIGAERISKDGYLQRKINNDMPFQQRWRGVHIINWEAVNGPLPKGHALVFRDGNKQNTLVENLELLSRAELMRRNSYHTNYPKEIAQLVQLRGAITRQLNKRARNQNGQ